MSKLFQFILYSNIWIALGTSSLLAYSYQINHSKINFVTLIFAFSATLITYTFQRFLKKKLNENFQNERIAWMQNNKLVMLLLIIAATILMSVSFFYLTIAQYILLIPSGVICFFYAGNLIRRKNKSLREIPFIKAHLIALIFAIICAYFPHLNSLSFNMILYGISIYLIVLSLAILFDIRDLNIDSIKLATVPQKIGIQKSKLLSIILFSLGSLLIAFVEDDLTTSLCLILTGIPLIGNTKNNSNEFYFSFLLDGILLIPGIVLLLRFFFFHP